VNLQSEMRRIEHLSSKHDSPRGANNGYDEDDEDFKKTQDLINKA
jgi:hypothetical protein